MKKTPKILPTYYKSKGTPIFRDTTGLPFAKGGPIEDEPGTPPTWNRPQLSAERIAALKALHGDSIFASANPNDLLFYDLNKEAIDNATDFSAFLDPSASVSKSFKEAPTTKDIKTRLGKGWALDTKTGAYFKVPEELYKEIVTPKEEPMETIKTLDPALIDRKPLGSLVVPEFPAFPTYQMPGYMKSYNFPTVGRYTPLVAKAVQQATGYDRNFMEGYYDEDGNFIPGELQNAQEQNRAPQFVGASSFKDMLAQREYLKTLQQTRGYAQGGRLAFEPSEYGSDAREHYADGGPIYTYSKRPGSYYQRTPEGWSIKNSSTGGNYVPIDDPTGERAALLNKYATVYNAPVQGAPNVVPATIKAQQTAKQINSPVIAEQRQAAADQIAANKLREDIKVEAQDRWKTLPQSAGSADWVFAAPMVAPMALEALGAFGNSALGQAANIGFGLHGASQVPARIGDWQDVAAGNKDWKEATAESLMTGLELAGGYNARKNLLPTVNKTMPQFTTQRPDLSHLGISPEQQELLNLQQVNNTTMLSSVAPAKKLKLYGEDYRSPAGLPSYMEPSLYSQEEMARRMTPYQQALMRINQTEKAADRVIKRTTDDKVYYDAEGNVLKTPEDNLARGGFLHKYPFGGDLAGEPVTPVQPTTPPDTNPVNPTAVNAAGVQDFYTNWYSKRTLPFAEIGNKQYEKVMRSVLPAYNPQSPLLNDITQKAVPYEVQPMIEGDPTATGALVYNKQGMPEKIQLKESILGNPKELDSTLVHEEHTRIMNPFADKVLPVEQMIINPSIKTFEEGWGNLKGDAADAAGEYYDYITDPQGGNIQSMLFEVRKSKNLQPDQIITDQDIESWKQEAEQSGALDPNNANYDNALYNLFKLGKDNASIKNLFNYIASNKTQQPNAMSGSMNNMG